MAGVAFALDMAVRIYILLVFVWVFGSWFPQWRYQEWFKAIDRVVAPYIAVFAPLRLQFSGFDFTPMVAIFALYLFRFALIAAAGGGRY